jgi:CheY-like chemotaxis protein
MTRTLHCLWIDDDSERLKSAVRHRDFAREVEIQVVDTPDEALVRLEAGLSVDLVLLDIQGSRGTRICREAETTRLAQHPWVLVSDLARSERIEKSDAVSLSSHFVSLIETSPAAAAAVLQHIARAFETSFVPPARAFIAHLLHDARRTIERARWELREASVYSGGAASTEAVARGDAELQALLALVDVVGLQ